MVVELRLQYYWDVLKVHICSARAQIQYFKSSMIVHFGGIIKESVKKKLFKNNEEKFNKISTLN